jgi:hypothetical protein
MTPADELRKAAERIREVAGMATPGGWGEMTVVRPLTEPRRRVVNVDQTFGSCSHREGNVAHIALWDPTVALVVAEWLESEADDADREAADSIYGAAGQDFVYAAGDPHPALKLARAINGGAR